MALFYNTIFRRTSTYVLLMVGGAFFFERTFFVTADYIFDKVNEGKLWKDIKSRYEEQQ